MTHREITVTHRAITVFLHAKQCRITALSSRDRCVKSRDELHTLRAITVFLHARQCRITAVTSRTITAWVTSRDKCLPSRNSAKHKRAHAQCQCHYELATAWWIPNLPIRGIWANRHRGLKVKRWRERQTNLYIFWYLLYFWWVATSCFADLQMDAILERFGLLESVRRRFKEEKVNWMCTWDYKWFCEQIHIAFKSQDYKCVPFLQIYASTIKLLSDKQLEELGIGMMGDHANLREMCSQAVRSKYSGA